jgi:hypothetical protein
MKEKNKDEEEDENHDLSKIMIIGETNNNGVTIRPRKLNFEKRLLLLRPIDLESIKKLKKRIVEQNFERYMNGNKEVSQNEYEQVNFNIKKLLDIGEVLEKKKVPVPECKYISNDDKTQISKFILPPKYINFTENYDDDNEYDLDSEDENFLNVYNKTQRDKISELDFESIISIIEKNLKAKVINLIKQEWICIST